MGRRIAISVPVVGGVGGSERAVWSIAHALPDDRVDVFTRRVGGGQLAQFPPSTRVRGPLWTRRVGPRAPGNRIINATLHAVRRMLLPTYDVHLHFMHGVVDADRMIPARRRFIDPIGSPVEDLANKYDRALLKSPANRSLIPDGMPYSVVPPPWFPLAETGDLPEGIPGRFFLTVMNPYGKVKGADVLRRVAARSALPVVWCYSEQSIDAGELGDGPLPDNVVAVVDATQEQIRGLHSACDAYVSFSWSEGFGWSLADALMYGAPIVSRRTGILTLPDLNPAGITFFDTEDELAEILSAWRPSDRVMREIPDLDPERFASRIRRIAREGT